MSHLDSRISGIEVLAIKQDQTVSKIAQEIRSLQEQVGEMGKAMGSYTPETQTCQLDVDPTPRPGLSQPKTWVKSPERSWSTEVKALQPSFPHISHSPSPQGFLLFPVGTTPGRATTPGPAAIPKIREPDAFDGTKGKKAADWALCALIWARHMRPTFPNEEFLVLHFPGLTKDWGADWARPHIGRIMSRKSGALTTLQQFSKEFEHTFNNPDAKWMAARKLNELTQTSDMESYITDFENLEAELNWNKAALEATFEKGLHWKVKELLSQVYLAPSTFDKVKTHALCIDTTRRENKASRPKRDNVPKKTTTATVKTTMLTTRVALTDLPNYVSPKDQDRCCAKNLCIKCSSPDHSFRDCKNGWKKEQVTGKGKKKEETAKIAEAESKAESRLEN